MQALLLLLSQILKPWLLAPIVGLLRTIFSTRQVSKSFSISACADSELNCGDILSIDMERRCNSVVNCKDMSDEMHCNVAEKHSGYNKVLTPPPGEGNRKVQVIIDVAIVALRTFDISPSNFELQLILGMKWFDGRLNFNNLRDKNSLNVMGPAKKSSI